MLLLPPQSRPPPKNPLPARFIRGAFVIVHIGFTQLPGKICVVLFLAVKDL